MEDSHTQFPLPGYNGDNQWVVRLTSVSARDAGYYTFTASNIMGSAGAELSLQVISTKEKYEDDLTIHHDETVVSGDISDPEFIEAIVSDMIGATYVNKIRNYCSNRR